MMLAALLALTQQAVAPAPPPPSPPPPPPPIVGEWPALPLLHLDHRPDMAALSSFVRAEVQAGRCRLEGASSVTVDLIVRLADDGTPQRIVPRAIDCPTVEQYAAGLVIRLVRGTVEPPTSAGWYHVALTFSW